MGNGRGFVFGKMGRGRGGGETGGERGRSGRGRVVGRGWGGWGRGGGEDGGEKGGAIENHVGETSFEEGITVEKGQKGIEERK